MEGKSREKASFNAWRQIMMFLMVTPIQLLQFPNLIGCAKYSQENSASNIAYISDLDPNKDLWDVKVRIISLWDQKYSIDMVLLDEKGDQIQGCVKQHLMSHFRPQLQRDDTVLISKCVVGEYNNKDKSSHYRVVNNQYKINFLRCTTVKRVSGFSGPEYGFRFVPFKDIHEGKTTNRRTVDVIGTVTWCGNLDIYGPDADGKVSKKFTFDLQDLEGVTLRCTLWDKYAQEFNKFVASYSSEEPVIAVIQHVRVKQWIGKFSLQNDKYGTRLFINKDLHEVNDLRRRHVLKQAEASSSQVTLSTQVAYPMYDEFVKETQRKNVADIRVDTEEMTCVVVATIKVIEEEFGWFYTACRECTKKVLSKNEYLLRAKNVIPDEILNAPSGSLICPKCIRVAESVTTKFKIQARVQDDTGSTSFVIFDRDVSRMLGLSAVDIREHQVTSGLTEVFPHQIERLVGKLLAFKIEVSDYNVKEEYPVFTARKVCDEPAIIAELLKNEEPVDESTQQDGDMSSARVSGSSQQCAENTSKDVISATGDSLPVGVDKDNCSSPIGKRPIQVPADNQQTPGSSSSSKSKRKRSLS